MIEELRVEHFRSFDQLNLEFANTTVLVGNNGVGKTSVLEAISMLSLTTSWKTEKDSEVVQWGQPFCRVTSGMRELVVQTLPYMKRIRIDGVSKRVAQVIGLFPTILFQPEDLALLYGAPSIRRQYIDRTISQTSYQYTKAAIQLQSVLKQRNRLLKNIQEGTASEQELPFWDLQLSELQEIIRTERLLFFAYLQEHVAPLFREMVAEGGDIVLHYAMSPHAADHSFLSHLERNRYKEVAAGITLYGPHREDVQVRWGDHPAEQSMSRGQSRSLMVAFKIAELGFITERSGIKPVLLLDDIFSELDVVRRQRLFAIFGDYQVIMTTTELGQVKEMIRSDTKVIELS